MTNPRPWIASLDMYRKVPQDLVEGSRQGSIVSWIALIVMATLFMRETQQFMSSKLVTDLSLDRSKVSKLKVDFNVTMLDLRCEYATINLVSVLGNEQNITKDITRWAVDYDGVRNLVAHRNPEQHDIVMHDESVKETIEELHENGEDAVNLNEQTLELALEQHEFVFVDFFASWCSHCRALAPTWERFAEVMHDAEDKAEIKKENYSKEEYEKAKKLQMPVLVAKVDCVEQHDLCMDEMIQGYPTLLLYVNGERYVGGEYYGDRTIVSFLQFLMVAEEATKKENDAAIKAHAEKAAQQYLNLTEGQRQWVEAMQRTRQHHHQLWNPDEHAGCQLAGSLHMNRVPGHFFIQAQSAAHSLDSHMANLSHEIHHLSFESEDWDKSMVTGVVPGNFEKSIAPMDGNVYITEELHEAYHHYIKLVSSNSRFYQMLQSSQLSYYGNDKVPETKFVLDISPIAVRYRIQRRAWYDYLTSLMAIVGGVFTVVGMIEAVLRVTTKRIARHQHSSKARRVAP